MRSAPLLITSPDRVFYRGHLGQPRLRRFAAAAFYAALGGQLRWSLPQVAGSIEGEGPALWVPSGVEHQIAVSEGPVLCYLVEPEFHDLSAVPATQGCDVTSRLQRLISLDLTELSQHGADTNNSFRPLDTQLDRLVLGTALPERSLDARIASVVDAVRADPACAWQAADAAIHCELSASRFMHLFKAEVGVGWRAFRAWKRARGLLSCVHSGESLTQLALALGYPDATHFSHAIRQVTGLRPSDILSGGRRVGVWSESGVSRGVAS